MGYINSNVIIDDATVAGHSEAQPKNLDWLDTTEKSFAFAQGDKLYENR
jgi:hypothetical protein